MIILDFITITVNTISPLFSVCDRFENGAKNHNLQPRVIIQFVSKKQAISKRISKSDEK